MIATRDQRVHAIIHTASAASAASAAVGAGLAQLPGSDAPVLIGIQSAMIIGVASEHQCSLDQVAATKFLLTFTARMAGRGLSQLLVGWLPGWGNAINAATAAGLTEAVGWAADAYFARGR